MPKTTERLANSVPKAIKLLIASAYQNQIFLVLKIWCGVAAMNNRSSSISYQSLDLPAHNILEGSREIYPSDDQSSINSPEEYFSF